MADTARKDLLEICLLNIFTSCRVEPLATRLACPVKPGGTAVGRACQDLRFFPLLTAMQSPVFGRE